MSSTTDKILNASFIASALAGKTLSTSISNSAPVPFSAQGLAAGENQALDSQNVFQYWDYFDISSGTSTVLATVQLNSTVIYGGYQILTGATAAVVTIYDNSSATGTVIESLPSGTVVGRNQLNVGIKCQTGLTVGAASAISGYTVRIFFRRG